MTRVSWSDVTDRYYETGLDRGVLYPNGGEAVAWNGLTSVDEDGGDSGTEFYMDGRPFLYLPKPKEFKASLNAYTYPDEFAALMGLAEMTDGMYLDSQQGDSFGLCYRTLVGDGASGEQAGYKIHLIYNATVVAPSSSYQTLSDSINASEFSFQIQAVPVPVVGYRPTAHVIIDTRHMDATRLEELEAVIYGNGSLSPTMPDPQIIHDMLNFGDGIIITDNGNGTWTAEGSYLNVRMVTHDVFEIDNVNAISHGDGTYDISTTP